MPLRDPIIVAASGVSEYMQLNSMDSLRTAYYGIGRGADESLEFGTKMDSHHISIAVEMLRYMWVD